MSSVTLYNVVIGLLDCSLYYASSNINCITESHKNSNSGFVIFRKKFS